jgi:hypothetical protein
LIQRAKTAVADLSPAQLALLTVFLEGHTNPDSLSITLDNLYANSFLRQMYRQSSSARLYGMNVRAGIELPSWLEQLTTADEDPWTQLAEDLDALEPWVYQADDGRYELEATESLTLLSLAYEGRARYGHTQNDLCSFLYQLLRTPTELAAANEPWATAVDVFLLVDASDLPDTKLRMALAELLELNCPRLADEANPGEGDGAMDWDSLASELLRRAWERTEVLDDAGAHRILKQVLGM